MSTKTSFKRISLAVVVALGFGFLSAPSQAAQIGETLTLSSSTSTAYTTETATVALTHNWGTTQAAANADSMTVKATCAAPTGYSCPTLQYYSGSDTANVQLIEDGAYKETKYISGLFTETASVVGGSVRQSINVKAVNFPAVGTYTYTFYTLYNAAVTTTSTTWTITVTNRDTTVASALKYISSDIATSEYYRSRFAASSDSAIVAVAGLATAPVAVGYALFAVKNAAGDTAVANAGAVANGATATRVVDTLTVTVSGPGLVTGISSTKAKSATVNAYNSGTIRNYTQGAQESITVWSDGTPGTSTISVSSSAGVTLTSFTVVFTGVPASASTSLSDTYTYIGGTLNLVAQVKDAASNLLTTGTMYVFSSDTKVVSAGASLYSNAATQYQTVGRCSSTWDTAAKTLTCSLTTGDTGTASIYLADSWNVTASSFVTTPLTLTVTGNTIASATVAFDKATYAPGERAVITITTKDSAGRVQATGATGTLGAILQTPTLTAVTALPYAGTVSGSDVSASSTVTKYMDSGVETRVVLMPNYGTDVSYSLVHATFGSTTGEKTTVTATAKVVDPTQAAQNVAIANAQAAADAATDAALQAIDAANAATDAANLAAEAADAATVAAQESKDAADAATAAVESLATQVATLMAALQAQITSLANVVAKIAKKVKA